MRVILMPQDVEYKHHLAFCQSLTNLEPNYRVKARKLLDGAIDYLMTPISYSLTKSDLPPKVLSDEELEEKRQENIKRAARRAKQVVHYAVRQIKADHLLTLTTRDSISDRDEFYAVFTRFMRLVRSKDLIRTNQGYKLITRNFNRDYAYVAVTELQERGAYHMHVACVGRQDLSLLRACWYVALGGSIDDTGDATKGAIDVQSNKKRFSGASEFFKTFKLVSYLTKYITKSFIDDSTLGLKRYSSSRGIPKPEVEYFYLSFFAHYGQEDAALTNLPYGTNQLFPQAIKALYDYAIGKGFTEFSPWNQDHNLLVLRASV